MAEKSNISKSMGMMAIVLQDKKISDEFIAIYQEMLADIPDDILVLSMKSCLLTCRFFPSIAEIREKAEPFLEKLRISKIENPDEQTCYQNVERDATNTPICKLESTCEFATTGKCKKWEH